MSSPYKLIEPGTWISPASKSRRSKDSNGSPTELSIHSFDSTGSKKSTNKKKSDRKTPDKKHSIRLRKIRVLKKKKKILSFITFGCWNRFVDPNSTSTKGLGFQQVLPAIQQHVDRSHLSTDFVLISGDNYYPTKDKDKNKNKKVNPTHLQDGFSMLPKNTDVHLILGNHDIETGSNIVDAYTDQSIKCNISKLEKSALHPEVGLKDAPKIHIFHAFMWTPCTAIIMFDTSLYDNLDEDTVDCYDVFEPLQITPDYDKRQQRIKEQEDYIMNFLKRQQKRQKEIQNVILMGHYPIVSIKMKEVKETEKDKKKADEESVVEVPKEKKKDKEKKMKEKAECCYFTHLFTNIYNHFTLIDKIKHPKYYYLCADVHMYQKVIVNIPIVHKPEKILDQLPGTVVDLDTGDESPKPIEPHKQMEITQFVVGTGGAELNEPPDTNPINQNSKRKTVAIPNTRTEHPIEFNVELAQKLNGFLQCILDPNTSNLWFEFHKVI
jgi:hypothetical protein